MFCAYGMQVVYYIFVGCVGGGEDWREIESVFQVFCVVGPVCFAIVRDGFSV